MNEATQGALPKPIQAAAEMLKDLESFFYCASGAGFERDLDLESEREEAEHHFERVCRVIHGKLNAIRAAVEGYDREKWKDNNPVAGLALTDLQVMTAALGAFEPDSPAWEIGNVRSGAWFRTFFWSVNDQLNEVEGLVQGF